MKQVSANAYMFSSGRGCNVGVVMTSEGIVMIDTPYMPSDAEALREELKGKGQVAYIIHTEPHLDHIAGSGYFSGTVVSHEGTRAEFGASAAAARQSISQMEPDALARWEQHAPRPPAVAFSERLTLRLGQHTFELTHLVGHSASQVAVLVPEERVVFTGDNVVYGTPVFMHQCYPYRWLESLKKIEAYDVDVIVPGHGDACGKEYLGEISNQLRAWVDAVKQEVDRGLSKEEVASSAALRERLPLPSMANPRFDLHRMNASRLYDVLTQGEEALLQV